MCFILCFMIISTNWEFFLTICFNGWIGEIDQISTISLGRFGSPSVTFYKPACIYIHTFFFFYQQLNDPSCPQHGSAFKCFKEAHKVDFNMSWLPRQVLTDCLHHLMLLRDAFFLLTFYILYILQTASHVHIFFSQAVCCKSPLNLKHYREQVCINKTECDREKWTIFKIWIDLATKKNW